MHQEAKELEKRILNEIIKALNVKNPEDWKRKYNTNLYDIYLTKLGMLDIYVGSYGEDNDEQYSLRIIKNERELITFEDNIVLYGEEFIKNLHKRLESKVHELQNSPEAKQEARIRALKELEKLTSHQIYE